MRDNENIEAANWLLPLSIEYHRQKICQCRSPHYVLDVTNRLVQCKDCGAILDPFDALLSVAKNLECIAASEQDLSDRIAQLENEADQAKAAFFNLKTTCNIAENYKFGRYPVCPVCHNAFDPSCVEDYTIKRPKK